MLHNSLSTLARNKLLVVMLLALCASASAQVPDPATEPPVTPAAARAAAARAAKAAALDPLATPAVTAKGTLKKKKLLDPNAPPGAAATRSASGGSGGTIGRAAAGAAMGGLPPGTVLPSGLIVFPATTDAPPIAIAPSAAATGSAPTTASVPAATASAPPAVSESTYTRLALPAVAERLKLTDEQRLKVAALLTDRAAALAKAAPEERAKVAEENEKKLADVLSDEQRTLYAQKPVEPKLRFNFRYQRWIDVLDWFARQADLSLVLDAPPLGTFNYSDDREYTPTEAIDLLNGVLLTKGFTLVRRERMLLVVNLAEGLPEGLIPRVTLEEADKRGKFELVSVLFPLQGRVPADVAAEIKPLLGPHGKSVPLPATGQLLVTDTAGVMRSIEVVVRSMPVSGSYPGGPSEPPELAVYPVRVADPRAVAETLHTLVPGATLVLDPKTSNISVLAGPTLQATLKKALADLDTAAPGDQQPRLELYPLPDSGTPAAALLATLQAIVPRAKLSIDPKTNRLTAWCAPDDHKQLAATIARLGGADAARQMVAYTLTSADPSTTLRVLTAMFPTAQCMVDLKTHRLLIRATPAEHEQIKQAIEKIDAGTPGDSQESFQTYPAGDLDAKIGFRTLQGEFPDMRLAMDLKGGTILAWGRRSDHRKLAETLKTMEGDVQQKPHAEVYALVNADPVTLSLTLKTLLPTARVAPDAKSGGLIVWATPQEHKSIRAILEQMAHPGPPETQPILVVYTIESGQTTTAEVSAAAPAAPLVKGKKGAAAPAAKPGKATQTVKLTPAAAVIPILKLMFPTAQFNVGTEPNRLAAWAKPAEQKEIKKAIDEISRREDSDAAPHIAIYTLESGTNAVVLPILRSMFPELQIAPGQDLTKIVVYARAADQEPVREAIEELGRKDPDDEARKLAVFTLDQSTAAGAMLVLKPIFPAATFALGSEPSKLVAWARPADQAAIQQALAEINRRDAADVARTVIAYNVDLPAGGATAAATAKTVKGAVKGAAVAPATGGLPGLIAVLKPMFPNAQFTAGADPRRLIVWARPADHLLIQRTIDEVNKRDPALAPQMMLFGLGSMTSTTALPVLKTMFPDAQFAPGPEPTRVIAYATPDDLKAIQAAVARLTEKEPPEQARKLVVYSLDTPTPAGASPAARPAGKGKTATATPSASTVGAAVVIPLLKAMFPDALINPGPDPRKLAVYARPADHEGIRKAVEEIGRRDPDELTPRAVVYTLQSTTAVAALPILRSLFPDALFAPATDAAQVIALARPADQEAIRVAVEQLAAKEAPQTARKVVVYNIDTPSGAAAAPLAAKGAKAAAATSPSAGAAALIPVLKTMFPMVQCSVGNDPKRLIVWARPAEHEEIAKVIAEIAKHDPASVPTVVTYALESTTSLVALPLLRAMFPDAQFSPGSEPTQILVAARPADHEAIRAAVAQMAVKEPAETAPRLMVYVVGGTSTAAAVPAGKGAAIKAAAGGAASLVTALKPMFPNAQFAVGGDPTRLLAWARPGEQEKIQRAIDEISKQEPAETAPRVVVYTAVGNTAVVVIPLLKTMFPDAQFSPGADPTQIVAFARPGDHQAIARAVDQMSAKEPAATARRIAVYTVDVPATVSGGKTGVTARTTTGAATLVPILKAMFPDVTFSAGVEPRQLIVYARPGDQASIQTALEELSKREPDATAAKVVVYTLQTASAAAALPVLKGIVPDAQLAPGNDPSQIVAYARPLDQAKIAAAIEQLSAKEAPETAPRVVVYQVGLGSTPTTPVGKGAAAATGRVGAGNASALAAALKPIFPNAQFSVGADPNRLVVWARPVDHEGVRKVLDEMLKREPAETAPKVAMYMLGANTAVAALPILKTMFPDVQFSPGTDPAQVIAYARPADHEAIQMAVDIMAKKEPMATAPQVAVYTIEGSSLVSGAKAGAKAAVATSGAAAAVIPTLKAMFPTAQFAVGADPARLIVWARPADQDDIKKAVETIAAKDPPATAPRVTVYTLANNSALVVVPMLKTMFPDAQFSAGNDPSQVIAFARPADHEKIKAAVEQMSAKEPPETAPQVVVYTVEVTASTSTTAATGKAAATRIPSSSGATVIIPTLKTMFPNAQFTVGADPSRLVAWARPADQKEIQKAITEISKKEPEATAPRVVVYTLSNNTAAVALPALKTMFPDAQFSAGSDPAQVIAFARPADQEAIQRAVAQISASEPAESAPQLLVYTVDIASAPGATVVTTKASAGSKGAAAVLPTLKAMYPNAQFSIGADPNRLIVWARPAEQRGVKAAIEELSKKEPPETAARVVVYTLVNNLATNAVPLLKTMFPDDQFAAGLDPAQVIAFARPSDHEKIKAAVEQMSAKDPPATAPQMAILTVDIPSAPGGAPPVGKLAAAAKAASGTSGAAAAIPTLKTIFPAAQFSVGSDPNRLIVWARPADLAEIRKAVAEMSKREPVETAARVALYTLQNNTALNVLPMLKSMFPDAQFSAGNDPAQVIAFARPADQEAIRHAVDGMSAQESAETAPQVVVYTIDVSSAPGSGTGKGVAASKSGSGAASVIPTLKTMYPNAQFTVGADPNRLVVWARPVDHAQIKKAIAEINKKEPAETAPKVVVYTLKNNTAANVLPMFKTMYPDDQFTAGNDPSQVIAFARPADHEKILAAVEQMSKVETPENAPRVVVYTVAVSSAVSGTTKTGLAAKSSSGTGAAAVIPLLTTMFPNAQFSVGVDPSRLVAWARPVDHLQIQKALDEISKREPLETAAKVVVYTLQNNTAVNAVPMLKTMFPDGQFSAGTDPAQVIAFARPADQEAIRRAVEQMSTKDPPDNAPQMAVLTVQIASAAGGGKTSGSLASKSSAGAAMVLPTLKAIFPNAQFSVGSDPYRLIVWARPADLKDIRKAVDEMSQKEPPATAPRMTVYTLRGVTAPIALPMLQSAFPDAQFTAGADPSQVLAFARPADHEKIQAAIEQLANREPAESAPRVVVYTVVVSSGVSGTPKTGLATTKSTSSGTSGAAVVIPILTTMFPNAQFAVGADPSRLVVWARPADHKEIQKALDEIAKREPAESAPRVVLYTLQNNLAATAVLALKSAFPDAQFTPGTDPSQVIAFARPADHDAIKRAIEQMSTGDTLGTAPKVVVYTLGVGGGSSKTGLASSGSSKSTTAAGILAAMKTMFPAAQLSLSSDGNRLIVWARAADHEAIRRAIDEMQKPLPEGQAPKVVVYTLGASNVPTMMPMLSAMFPNAQFGAGGDPATVVAYATQADHAEIKRAIEAMARKDTSDAAPKVAVFTIPPAIAGTSSLGATKTSGAAGLVPGLKLMFPDAQFSVGVDPNRLIVWARAADHPAIAKAINDIARPEPPETAQRAVVYHLKLADPKAAQSVAQSLSAIAQVTVDLAGHSVVVTAPPADQAKIKAALDDMDRDDPAGGAPQLRVHKVAAADGSVLSGILLSMYKTRPDVSISYDDRDNAIVAVAPAAQQELIHALVEQADKGALADKTTRLELFSLKNVDSNALSNVLGTLFAKEGTNVQLSIEPWSNQLIAIARPQQLEQIRYTVEQMRGQDRGMEVVQLEVNDANVAQEAIDRMFTENGVMHGPSAPIVDVDTVGQQLFIQCTQDQYDKIRKLLIKMGETGLAETREGNTKFQRTIAFPSGNVSQALEEMKRSWSQLRPNPIQVLPKGATPTPDAAPAPAAESTPAPEIKPEPKPEVKPEPKPESLPLAKPLPRAKPLLKLEPPPEPAAKRKVKPRIKPEAKPVPGRGAADDGAPDHRRRISASLAALVEAGVPAGDVPTERKPVPGAPIVVAPSENSVTITSDDPAALDQFESLLRSMAQKGGMVGRNLTVYPLQNARAAVVSVMLQSLFRSTPAGRRPGTSAGTLVVLPDPRLNALIVQCSRVDKPTIDNLVHMLDSADVPEALTAARMKLIPIRNTAAANIQQILMGLYNGQVDALGVEENTNSLVVTAPPTLAEEITRFARVLDDAAGADPARKLKLIPLHANNSARIQAALALILKRGANGTARPGSVSVGSAASSMSLTPTAPASTALPAAAPAGSGTAITPATVTPTPAVTPILPSTTPTGGSGMLTAPRPLLLSPGTSARPLLGTPRLPRTTLPKPLAPGLLRPPGS